MKDKKAAKRLIKLAKEHPDWYTKRDVWYAKMIKKTLKHERKIDKRNARRRKDDGIRGESEQSQQPVESSSSWFARLLHKARSLVRL
jgi:hypothetical protein